MYYNIYILLWKESYHFDKICILTFKFVSAIWKNLYVLVIKDYLIYWSWGYIYVSVYDCLYIYMYMSILNICVMSHSFNNMLLIVVSSIVVKHCLHSIIIIFFFGIIRSVCNFDSEFSLIKVGANQTALEDSWWWHKGESQEGSGSKSKESCIYFHG